ncbi:MAG: IS4 family transposase [Candidatus Schekmanbacteria bacterium]|nr:IS4 family transposase [Candidatus Schekmanbacteria bacterium]
MTNSFALMEEEWHVLASLLPNGWQGLARELGAMRRARGEVRTPELLLQLLLLHVATGLSLKQAVARAEIQGMASLTDVALLKRLRTSEGWLRELSRRMFESSRFANAARAPSGRRLRAIDASTVEEPGATGTDWRVHYCIGLPDLACDFYQLTSVKGGESFTRLPVQAGDIVLGDRGYCHRQGVAYVLEQRGDVIVRMNSANFPLLSMERNEPFPLLASLRSLRAHLPDEWPVQFQANDRTWGARLCAIRKSVAAAKRAKDKIRRVANKKGKKFRPETLEFAEYVFVLTTMDRSLLESHEVLELYRARWQIELCFKRLKSLMKLGHLPKRSDASARAWIQGKLLTVMLIERLAEEARFFSPWGFNLTSAQPLEGIH